MSESMFERLLKEPSDPKRRPTPSKASEGAFYQLLADIEAERSSKADERTANERLDERESDPPEWDADERSEARRRRRGTDIARVPEARRCQYVNALSLAKDKRCKGWTRSLGEGRFDRYCKAHSKDPKANERLTAELKAATEASIASRAQQRRTPKTLLELLRGPVKSQDEVEAIRLAVLESTVSGDLVPQRAQVVLQGLKDVSQHIERYGAVQGAEGGHSYMRLMPGVTITEYEDPLDQILTGDDIERIDAGIAEDVRRGIAVPEDFGDCVARYLNRPGRRRERSRFDVA